MCSGLYNQLSYIAYLVCITNCYTKFLKRSEDYFSSSLKLQGQRTFPGDLESYLVFKDFSRPGTW